MTAAAPLVTVQQLALRRGVQLLFSGVDFAVHPGEMLLVRGPNGVGKSSLLLTLFGLLRPESGRIVWPGEEPPRVHLLAHAPGVKARLTLRENLHFWQAMNGAPAQAPEAALDAVGLGALADLDAGYLSAGQTKRLALARLLVSARPLWLLDEPTASLDAAGDSLVAGLVAAHLRSGGGVIAATHDDIAGATGTLMLERPQ